MAYFAPYIDESGIHMPTYEDRLQDLRDKYRSIFGQDAALDPAAPDYQLLSVFAKALDDTSAYVLSAYHSRNPACTIYWNIPVGTEVEIVDQRENWSKCICSGLTGWMKNEFIRTGGEEDLPGAPEPSVSEDPSQFEDAQPDPELEQALKLLADVYQALQGICERILSVVGRG